MIVLVTGASGFVGRHLTRALHARGDQVHAVLRASSTRPDPQLPAPQVHRLTDPSAQIGSIVDAVQPELVFHLATHFAARHLPGETISMLESNVVFGSLLAQACAAHGARLVHTTSAWQHYGGAEYEPVSLYAATKQALVDVLEYFRIVEQLDAREVCLFDTYGPDDDRGKLVSALISAMRDGRSVDMSSGRQLVDLVHIDDVVAALLLAAESPTFGRRMVARSGQPISVRDVVAALTQATGHRLEVRWGARPDRTREMVDDWPVPGDNLGWSPMIPLRDGLAALWRAE